MRLPPGQPRMRRLRWLRYNPKGRAGVSRARVSRAGHRRAALARAARPEYPPGSSIKKAVVPPFACRRQRELVRLVLVRPAPSPEAERPRHVVRCLASLHLTSPRLARYVARSTPVALRRRRLFDLSVEPTPPRRMRAPQASAAPKYRRCGAPVGREVPDRRPIDRYGPSWPRYARVRPGTLRYAPVSSR